MSLDLDSKRNFFLWSWQGAVSASAVALFWVYNINVHLGYTFPVYILLFVACVVYYAFRDKLLTFIGRNSFRTLHWIRFGLITCSFAAFAIFLASYFLGLLYSGYYAQLSVLNRMSFLGFLGFILAILPFGSVFTPRGFVVLSLEYVVKQKEEKGILEMGWLKRGLKRLVDMLSPTMKISFHTLLFKMKIAYFDGEDVEDDLRRIADWIDEYHSNKPVDHVKFRNFYTALQKYVEIKEPTRGYEWQENPIPFLNLIVVNLLGIISVILVLPKLS